MWGHLPVAPLVGRDAEVAALLAAAADARAGESRCVVVTGEAGIGKTRLVAEALAGLGDGLVLTGRAADMSTGEIPFGVLADTLRDLLRQGGADQLAPTETEVLAPLLPGSTATGSVEPARIHSFALDLLARLCAQDLLVWVVEDLHWADAATRDLVRLAARTLRGHLLLVVTARTDDPAKPPAEEGAVHEELASLLRAPHATRLDLQRLTVDQVLALVHSLTRDDASTDVPTITRLSDGVPFYVEELTAAHGHAERSTAAAALAARTTRLTPAARRLVEAAAVGDGHLRISLLEQVLGAGPEEFDAALADAVKGGVLTCDPDADHLGFRHALLRENVHRSLGPGARRDWHRRWAEVLEQNPGVLATDPALLAVAEHWHHAGDVTRSVSAAYAATSAARRTGDDTAVLELWLRVLQGWDQRDPASDAGRLTLREAVGRAFRHPIVDDPVLRSALEAARGLPLQRPEQLLLEVVADAVLGSAKAGPTDRTAIVRASSEVHWLSEPADELTLAALVLLGGFLPAQERDRADAFLLRAESLAEAAGDRDRLIDVADARSHLLTRVGDPVGSIAVLERALQLLGPGQAVQRLGFAGDLGWNHLLVGRHQVADALLTEALERTPHLETMTELWEHVVENAMVDWMCMGQWARARQTLAAATPWWPDDLRMSNLWQAHLDLLVEGATEERRWRNQLGAAVPGGPDEVDVRQMLAEAAGLRGDLSAMRNLATPVWHEMPGSDFTTMFLGVVHLSRIEASAAYDDPDRPDRDEAADHLARMADGLAAVPHPMVHEEAAALELTAQTERFHGRDPRKALEAVLEASAAIDHVPDAAVTHLSLAEAHARAGDRDTARTHLGEGRRIATELGARPWVVRAAEIAHRYGFSTRERRPAEVFTNRELEVLQLLGEGRTNKEIAATLFISPKTASVHVSRIITKTDATNRTEAVANARRRGLLLDE